MATSICDPWPCPHHQTTAWGSARTLVSSRSLGSAGPLLRPSRATTPTCGGRGGDGSTAAHDNNNKPPAFPAPVHFVPPRKEKKNLISGQAGGAHEHDPIRPDASQPASARAPARARPPRRCPAPRARDPYGLALRSPHAPAGLATSTSGGGRGEVDEGRGAGADARSHCRRGIGRWVRRRRNGAAPRGRPTQPR